MKKDEPLKSFFSVIWLRRIIALILVLGMSFLIAIACDDDDNECLFIEAQCLNGTCNIDCEANSSNQCENEQINLDCDQANFAGGICNLGGCNNCEDFCN